MRIYPHNNNSAQNTSFKAKIMPNGDELAAIRKFTDCGMGHLTSKLIDSIQSKAPNVLGEIDGQVIPLKDTISRRAVSSIKSFFGMPLDVLDAIASKFPNSRFYNLQFLQKHRETVRLDDEIGALQGIYEKAYNMLPKGVDYPKETGVCTDYCESICHPIADNFIIDLNKAMGPTVADYDTKKERFAARLISGFTAAFFLGNDFYNKSIQKGRTEEQAKKEQHLKQGQEIIENICEAIAQFAVFACFSKQVNKSVWAPAIIGAAIGLVSRVISRLAARMPIRRIKVQEGLKPYTPSMQEYVLSAKQDSIDELPNNQLWNDNKNKKAPILSIKNILLFCLGSIVGGYALRFLKGNTRIGSQINRLIQNHANSIKSQSIEEVVASKDTLKRISMMLTANNENALARYFTRIGSMCDSQGKISLGTDYKTTKLFGLVEVKTKDLKEIPTAPIRFIKELVTYPYKIATRLEEAIRNSRLRAKGLPVPEKPEPLEDPHKIKNIYKKFLEFEEKYGENQENAAKEFKAYIHKMRIRANNSTSSSKNDNSKIAVIAQTLGTLTGMGFSMNDEYNSAIRNGSSKEVAQKDARLRGINKFFRMTVQVIISGTLNGLFSKQYNNSIAKAGLVVAASTVLTDMASRILTGMPSTKMTKEELEDYQQNHKEGIMSHYYKAIDFLAS